MTKSIKTILFLFLFCFSAQAETIQLMPFGHTASAGATSGNNFFDVLSSSGTNTTEANRRMVASSAGTIIRMMACISVDPNNGAGTQSVTFAARINGATTSTSCTISEGDTDLCCDTETTSTYSAGQTIAGIQTAANTPVAFNFWGWTMAVDNTNNKTIYNGSTESSALSNSATQYGTFAASNGTNATENLEQVPMPFAGNVVALYVLLIDSPDNGAGTQSYTFKVYKNGSATGGNTCAISETATTCNDTSTSLSFNAGDTLSWEYVPANTPTARRANVSIAVTNSVGGFALFGGQPGTGSTNFDGTTTMYHPVQGPFTWNATETNRQQISSQIQLWSLYADLNTAPDNGAGTQTYTLTARDDAAATGCSCVVSEANVNCNDTCNPDDVLVNSKTALESVPAGTAAGSGGFIGVHAFIPPRDIFIVN